MIKTRSQWFLPMVLITVGGCGSIPDAIVSTVKQSAKDEIEQKIDDLLAQYAGQIDLSTFFSGLQAPQTTTDDGSDRGATR